MFLNQVASKHYALCKIHKQYSVPSFVSSGWLAYSSSGKFCDVPSYVLATVISLSYTKPAEDCMRNAVLDNHGSDQIMESIPQQKSVPAT